jgi:hypothetical protein
VRQAPVDDRMQCRWKSSPFPAYGTQTLTVASCFKLQSSCPLQSHLSATPVPGSWVNSVQPKTLGLMSGSVQLMTFFEAALVVLESSRRPLSSTEIIERIRNQNLVKTTGRTPEATLSATLYRHLGKHPELRREHVAGKRRALRGSVRWRLEKQSFAGLAAQR